MSKPFTVALAGLIVFITILTVGELNHSKDAFPLAVLLGGAMMIGGIVLGVARSLTRRSP
jgi:hypothetical protein